MQCVLGFAAAFGCRRPAKSRSAQIMFIRTIGRLCRYSSLKVTRPLQCKASCEQRLRNTGKSTNFSAAKNLPFCTHKAQKLKGSRVKVERK